MTMIEVITECSFESRWKWVEECGSSMLGVYETIKGARVPRTWLARAVRI